MIAIVHLNTTKGKLKNQNESAQHSHIAQQPASPSAPLKLLFSKSRSLNGIARQFALLQPAHPPTYYIKLHSFLRHNKRARNDFFPPVRSNLHANCCVCVIMHESIVLWRLLTLVGEQWKCSVEMLSIELSALHSGALCWSSSYPRSN